VLTGIELKILSVLQEGLPRSRRPYKAMAQRIGIETSELLAFLKDWERDGRLRRIGAILNHFKVGFSAGAMVVWQVESDRIAEIGQALAEFEEVSHAYQRRTSENWPYNFYTMVHGKTAEGVQQIVERMSRTCGLSKYRVLTTEKELKKVSPTYVIESK